MHCSLSFRAQICRRRWHSGEQHAVSFSRGSYPGSWIFFTFPYQISFTTRACSSWQSEEGCACHWSNPSTTTALGSHFPPGQPWSLWEDHRHHESATSYAYGWHVWWPTYGSSGGRGGQECLPHWQRLGRMCVSGLLLSCRKRKMRAVLFTISSCRAFYQVWSSCRCRRDLGHWSWADASPPVLERGPPMIVYSTKFLYSIISIILDAFWLWILLWLSD